MDQKLNSEKPIFSQIAENIESSILDGSIKEGEKVPSTNEFGKYYQINPATASKGINQLVDQKILFKKRGIGMFVADGAKEMIFEKRKKDFYNDYIIPLKAEANKLGLSKEELSILINKEEE
ncbi:GntR family transcriptional regulator [Cytobacillus sp. Hm23]